jgi:hypothetical protein
MSEISVRPLPTAPGGLAVAALAVLAALVLLFAVAFDQGQLAGLVRAAAEDSTVHEFFHDTRHMLGFPCH